MTEGAPTPPPGGWRGFWKRRSKIGKAALIAGAVFVALIILALAIPTSDEPENASADVTTEEDTTQPATTEEGTTEEATTEETTEEATTEEAAAPQEAADEDTGRMSDGEYESFVDALTEVDEEINQFGTTMQKCGVLMQALQLADASECVDDAYSGFEDKASYAFFIADDLKDDVAKGCLAALTKYEIRLDRFSTYVSNLHEAGANLQAVRFTRIAKRVTKQTRAYATARDTALLECLPT